MELLYPLGLLGLIGVPIIIIIYLLKSRYVQKPVSSTFIWKRSLKYVKRRVPINFIMSLLLILQILAVILSSFAITRPKITPFSSNETIVIVDASASMLTKNGDKTRFDVAKEKILQAAEKIGDNNQVTLIVAAEEAATLLSRSTDPVSIITAVEGLKCSQGTANIDGALALAKEVIEENAGATIQLYTDKEYIDPDGIEIINCADSDSWNIGVISMSDDLLVAGYKFNVGIKNTGPRVECTVKLEVDGKLVDSSVMTFDAESDCEIVFSPTKSVAIDPAKNQRLSLISQEITAYERATVTLSIDDGLSDDNTFSICSKETVKPRILLISKNIKVDSKGNVDTTARWPLIEALGSNGYVIKSDDMHLSADAVDYSGYDLYIFEGVTPTKMPTDGAVWLLNPPERPQGTSVIIDYNQVYSSNAGFLISKSDITDTKGPVYQITKNAPFETIKLNYAGQEIEIPPSVREFSPITKYDGFTAIYSSQAQPIMVVGTVGAARTIITSFDFDKTSLAIFASDFPVLIRNMAEYTLPEAMPERTAEVGKTIKFKAPAGSKTITFIRDGAIVDTIDTLELDSSLEYPFTIGAVGTYQIHVMYEDLSEQTFSLTAHIPEEETNVFAMGDELDKPEAPFGVEESLEPIEVFPYIMAILILLLIIEWGVYYRDEF